MLHAIDHRMPLFQFRRMLALLVLCVTTANLATAAEFIRLGYADRSEAYGVSDDGSVVAGSYTPGNGYWEAFRWTEKTGIIGLGVLGNGPDSDAGFLPGQPVSRDGTTIVGTSAGEAFAHTTAGGMEGSDVPGSRAAATSADGSVRVGLIEEVREGFRYSDAFYWTREEGVVSLSPLQGDTHASATDISSNGSIIAGTSRYFVFTEDLEVLEEGDREAFIWTAAEGVVGTGVILGDANVAITDDGHRLAGTAPGSGPGAIGREAFYWSKQGGMERLGWLPEAEGVVTQSVVRDMTPDGRVIAGFSGVQDALRPFIWTDATGMVDFQESLIDEYGLASQLTGWKLRAIQGMSSNAQFLTGFGHNPNGDLEAWLVRLDAPWGTQTIPEPTTAAIALLALVPLAVWRTRGAAI